MGLTQDMLAVLEAVPSSPERAGQEIALRTSLARALMATKGFTPEVEAAFAGAVELFERGTDVGQQYSVLRGLASLYMFRAQLDESARLGQRILELGEREGDPGMLIDGHLLVGTMLMSFDDLHAGLDHLDRAIALFPAQRSRPRTARVGNDPRISCLTTSGHHPVAAGLSGSRRRTGGRCAGPRCRARAPVHLGVRPLPCRPRSACGDGSPEIALDLAVGLRDLAEEHEFRIWIAVGGVLLGCGAGRPRPVR